MHPGDTGSISIDFDVRDFDKVALSPRINRLSDSCLALKDPGREGGVVGLTVLLDGKPVSARQLVDRNTKNPVPVEIGQAKTLRLQVDKGNDVSWCDWFSVGFPELHARTKAKHQG